MKRSRIWLLLALLLAIALVTSGCFQIRAFSVNRKSLGAKRGGHGQAAACTRSALAPPTPRSGRVVLLIGTDDIAYDRASQVRPHGNWGGPVGQGRPTTPCAT